MERKCDYDPVVRKSAGRATCPDNLFKSYKIKDECARCPKANGTATIGVSRPRSEVEADILLRDIKREQYVERTRKAPLR